MKRRLFGMLAALAAVLGIAFATGGVAQAKLVGVGPSSCNENWVCIWPDQWWQPGSTNQGYSGGYGDIDNAWVGNLANDPDGWKLNDATSSLVNNSGWSWCFFGNANFGGSNFRAGPDEWWGTLPNWTNDVISSFKNC